MTHSDELRELDEIDQAWNDAYRCNDRTPLGRILADGFGAVLADGRSITKAQLMQPGPVPREVAFSERSLQVFGDTAIARGRLSLQHDRGAVDQRFMRVYTRQEGRWLAVAVQVCPVQG